MSISLLSSLLLGSNVLTAVLLTLCAMEEPDNKVAGTFAAIMNGVVAASLSFVLLSSSVPPV